MNAGLTAVSCIAWLGGGVASPHAWQVNSADEKRGFTSDDRTRTLPETQAITPCLAPEELAAAHRAQSRLSPPDSRQSRGGWDLSKNAAVGQPPKPKTVRATEKRRDAVMSGDMASCLSANTT